MEGTGLERGKRETPVFMRLRSTLPFKTMRLEAVQSQSKSRGFPQFSWVFWVNPRFLPVFGLPEPLKPAFDAGVYCRLVGAAIDPPVLEAS